MIYIANNWNICFQNVKRNSRCSLRLISFVRLVLFSFWVLRAIIWILWVKLWRAEPFRFYIYFTEKLALSLNIKDVQRLLGRFRGPRFSLGSQWFFLFLAEGLNYMKHGTAYLIQFPIYNSIWIICKTVLNRNLNAWKPQIMSVYFCIASNMLSSYCK